MAMKDPMLQAAAEALRDHPDHLRWMSYADDELARLRERAGLPTPNGYAQGMPQYPTPTSAKAQDIRRQVESRMGGRFSPGDRLAVESVLDEIFAVHRLVEDVA
jgi:hypothetical protein